ncbi:MAG TPA: acyl-CoA dehydrogenase family protein [Acidimicrobiia bacterium]|nr:acyl-CoA dehydrogenase family protein [Acidimicrobiia bacterium]
MGDTHVVLNQTPPLVDYDMASADPVLTKGLSREGAAWSLDSVEEYGRRMSSAEIYEWGFLANRNSPTLHTHDRYGHRADQVEFHPAWHSLLDLAVSHGLHSLPWEHEPGDGGYPARAALTFLASQVEAGHFCPISMSTSVIPTLRRQPEVAAEWEPLQLSRVYDSSFQPGSKKSGVLMGMGMTEKQGGSDVRANTTVANPINGGGPGAEHLLTGHKWFMSAPMSDAFVVLANAPGGLSCFLLPRFTPDGEVNRIHILRLKDKLGNRSNASSEVELDQAWGRMVGDEGRGVATIIEMVAGTRLDCITGSAALMRQAVSQAIHHSAHRRAFGSSLIEKPLMLNVLADLEIETEAAVLLMMRVAGSFDRAPLEEHESLIRRILTPVAKYWVSKRCSEVVREAIECLGGNGYVEDSIMPRLYRESPVNAIWEGSGNVIALDLVRAIAREPGSVDALQKELEAAKGTDRRLDAAIDSALDAVRSPLDAEYEARRLVEALALATSGALLARHASPEVWEGFAAGRLVGDWGHLYGTLPVGIDTKAIIDPAIPRT